MYLNILCLQSYFTRSLLILFWGGGTICDTVAAAAAAAAVVEQNTILRLDLILVVLGC